MPPFHDIQVPTQHNKDVSAVKKEREWLASLLDQMRGTGFYGKVTLVLEAGKITRIVNEQSLRPPYLP
jgi:hypothetical protein